MHALFFKKGVFARFLGLFLVGLTCSAKLLAQDNIQITTIYSKYLSKNQKIQALQDQIDALSSKAKVVSKWDNPILYLGYNNANVSNFYRLDSTLMQNMSLGLSQKVDLNGKRFTQSKIIDLEKQKKILELKKTKQQLAINLMINGIENYKNQQELKLLEVAIKNLENTLYKANNSSSPNLVAIAKLEILKSQLEIKKNNLEDALSNSHYVMSELTFGGNELLSIAPKDFELNKEQEMQKINNTNYDIAMAKIDEQKAQKDITLAKKSFFDDVNITGVYYFRSQRYYNYDMFSIGMSIPLPIYGKQARLVEQKKRESLASKSEVENAKNRTHHLALKLIKKIETLQKNLQAINKILEQNEKIVQIYASDLPSGSDYNAYYNSFNDKINIEITQIETLSALNSTYLSLQNLKGLE
ncbi:copper resistance outer membrane protein CrdB [Helicobacter cetorum]|uniref:copper resistance outer membrane protein CrdB n=1 Tax=Helicobacter cetorum TaxID=138563 RepID=UPI000CF06E46|nr:copper resistance outer membrane protein CrdB [Helicobacter cetorum]